MRCKGNINPIVKDCGGKICFKTSNYLSMDINIQYMFSTVPKYQKLAKEELSLIYDTTSYLFIFIFYFVFVQLTKS